MASEFSPSTEVLYFRPRAHARWRPPRKYLLWPAWVYRVVAPMPRPRRLNVLEKAVLGLSRAGIRRAELIGPRLHIEPDLAAHILLDLMERGILDENAQPTARGRELLLEEIAGTDEMRVGHVFQDPITGELWPRFVERLDFAKREFGNGPYPSLELGTDGRPHRERPFMHLLPRLSPPPRPAPEDILRASRQHRAWLRHASERSLFPELDDDGEGEESGESHEVLSRISYVDEYPKPVFLTTYLYLPEGSEDDLLGDGWYVCDPFGLGASPPLRRRIEQAMERSERLREEIERMIGKPLKDRQQEQQELANELRTVAQYEVEKYLTLAVRNWPGYERLVEMEWVRQEAKLLGDRLPAHKLRAVLMEVRSVLEESFALLAERHPLGLAWQKLYLEDRPLTEEVLVRAHYERAAQDVGFVAPIPDRLAGVQPGQVRAACQSTESWRLRPLIMATLLCAAAPEQSLHPLRYAARKEPRFLVEVDQLAELCGAAAHAGRDPLDSGRVYQAVDQTYRIVELLSTQRD